MVLFLGYISCSPTLDSFKHIHWAGSGGVYSGDVIIGDIEANKWKNLLALVEEAPNQLELIAIKDWIKRQISWTKRSADNERMRQYLSPDR